MKAHNPKSYQPFRYPGGKAKLAANPAFRVLLDPLVEKQDIFYEGFVGSAAVTIDLALRYPTKQFVITDKDPTIAAFWKLIATGTYKQAQEFEALIYRFSELPPVRNDPKNLNEPPNLTKVAYFRSLREGGIPTGLVRRAYHALFFNRTTFSGIAMSQPIGGFNQSSEWTIDCRYNATALVNKFYNLRELFRDRLVATEEDCFDWLQRIPSGVPLYLDPPYFEKGDALYPVSMENFEHARFANSLKTRTNWVMSYDVCSEVTQLYEWAKLLTLPFRYSINGEKTDWKSQHEYLICSPDVDTRGFTELIQQRESPVSYLWD